MRISQKVTGERQIKMAVRAVGIAKEYANLSVQEQEATAGQKLLAAYARIEKRLGFDPVY